MKKIIMPFLFIAAISLAEPKILFNQNIKIEHIHIKSHLLNIEEFIEDDVKNIEKEFLNSELTNIFNSKFITEKIQDLTNLIVNKQEIKLLNTGYISEKELLISLEIRSIDISKINKIVNLEISKLLSNNDYLMKTLNITSIENEDLINEKSIEYIKNMYVDLINKNDKFNISKAAFYLEEDLNKSI